MDFLVKYLSMILRQADHLLILLGIQIHKVIVDGIDIRIPQPNLIMDMGTGTFTCRARLGNLFTSNHILPLLYQDLAEMGISGLITIAMVYLHQVSVAGLPFGIDHLAVSGCIDWSTGITCKVHSVVEPAYMINRVITVSVSRCSALKVLV